VKVRGSVLALSFSASVVILGFGLIMPYLPLYAEALGAQTGLEIGLLSSAFLLTRTLLATVAGSASDRYGRKKLIIAGMVLYTVVSIFFGLANSWLELLLYRTIQGVASAMVWSPATALVADLTPPGERGFAMGLYNSVSMSGWMFGPALGGAIQWYARNAMMLPLTDSYRVPFYFASVLSLVSLLLVHFFVRVPAEQATKRETIKFSMKEVNAKFRKTVYVMFFIVCAYGFATSFIEPLLVYFVKHEYMMADEAVVASMSVIFFVSSVLMMGVQIYAGRMADRISRKKMIVVPSVIAQLLTILMPYSANITQIGVVMTARTAAYGASSPAYTAFQQDLLPRNVRGALTGVLDTFFGIGSFIGPVLSFAIYDNISHSMPFILSGILGMATMVVLLRVAYEPKKEEVMA